MNKKILLSLATLLTLPLSAETMLFQEFNFSLESPSSWRAANPPPANATGFIQSADGSKGLVIIGSEFAKSKLPTALDDMVRGAKNSAAEQGASVQNEKSVSINGVPFKVFTTNLPDGVSIVSYMGLSENIGYSLQGFSKTSDAGTDAEIINIVNSFNLINKTRLTVSKSVSDNEAYHFGMIAGRFAIVTFSIGAIWILVAKNRKK